MTADRRAALVEGMAKVLCTSRERNGGPPWDYVLTMGKHVLEPLFEEASAALDLALEEAAKVVEIMSYDYDESRRVAAAIRKLKGRQDHE